MPVGNKCLHTWASNNGQFADGAGEEADERERISLRGVCWPRASLISLQSSWKAAGAMDDKKKPGNKEAISSMVKMASMKYPTRVWEMRTHNIFLRSLKKESTRISLWFFCRAPAQWYSNLLRGLTVPDVLIRFYAGEEQFLCLIEKDHLQSVRSESRSTLRCGLGLRSEIAGADIWVGLDALASPVTTLSSSSSLSAPAVICPAGWPKLP